MSSCSRAFHHHGRDEFVKANRRNKKSPGTTSNLLRDILKLAAARGSGTSRGRESRAGSHSLNDTNIRGVTANMADIDPIVPRDGRYIPKATITAARWSP